jgi:hypothetical protein
MRRNAIRVGGDNEGNGERMGMTTIRLTCTRCGDVQLLAPEDMALELDPDGREDAYRFKCATCIAPQRRAASAQVVTVLLATGVSVDVFETDPITFQEIAAFAAMLDAEPYPIRFLPH